jgi:hypothetical protein
MYRAQRRCIGHPWLSRYPALKDKLHHYVGEVIVDFGRTLRQMNHPTSATGMR